MEPDNHEIIYEEKYVAFLDILGFSDMIMKQSVEESIQTIKQISSIFSILKERIDSLSDEITELCIVISKENNDGLEEEFIKDYLLLKHKMFSDCICISCKNVGYLCSLLSNVQTLLAANNIFIRGGLSFGHHFENNNIIFSEGLVKAYKLESDKEKAKYPRIIIDNELLKLQPEIQKLCLKSEDGYMFLDFLDEQHYADKHMMQDNIISIRNAINHQVLNSRKDSITQKYNWLVEYFNFKVEDKYKIEPSVFKFAYKKYEFE